MRAIKHILYDNWRELRKIDNPPEDICTELVQSILGDHVPEDMNDLEVRLSMEVMSDYIQLTTPVAMDEVLFDDGFGLDSLSPHMEQEYIDIIKNHIKEYGYIQAFTKLISILSEVENKHVSIEEHTMLVDNLMSLDYQVSIPHGLLDGDKTYTPMDARNALHRMIYSLKSGIVESIERMDKHVKFIEEIFKKIPKEPLVVDGFVDKNVRKKYRHIMTEVMSDGNPLSVIKSTLGLSNYINFEYLASEIIDIGTVMIPNVTQATYAPRPTSSLSVDLTLPTNNSKAKDLSKESMERLLNKTTIVNDFNDRVLALYKLIPEDDGETSDGLYKKICYALLLLVSANIQCLMIFIGQATADIDTLIYNDKELLRFNADINKAFNDAVEFIKV